MISTSFAALRSKKVERIEIPIIQRDYAQGREDEATKRIRGSFLGALLKALEPDAEPLSLDFIYGEVRKGTLIPLDGQQRLTTLFLLHWYLAARAGIETEQIRRILPTFTYKTRTSSTAFCIALTTHCCPPFSNPSADEKDPNMDLGVWIRDQSWFPRSWERDPTITGMLVTLNDLHRRFSGKSVDDLKIAWDRLTDTHSPAIHFDFLSIEDIGSADAQYIRMNARGKPLTEFERFKARFEEMLGHASRNDRETFEQRIDGPWTDLLWPLRDIGKNKEFDTVIDDEFLLLFRYLSALVVWKFKPSDCSSEPGDRELHTWAERLYGKSDTNGKRRRFLFETLNALYSTFGNKDKDSIEAAFARWFTTDTHVEGKVALFAENTNLLAACVEAFGNQSKFTFAQQLLLYALVYGWMKPDVQGHEPNVQRLRVLRNLMLAPDADLRQERVADYFLPGVEFLIGLPAGAGIETSVLTKLPERQLAEEVVKQTLKSSSVILAADLERLEDHPLLRGCLFAFDLQATPEDIHRRVNTFYELFPPKNLNLYGKLLTAALLTKGDYGRPLGDRFQFGSATQDRRWRDVLTGVRKAPSTIQTPLAELLDDASSRAGDIDARLMNVIDDWLNKQNRFDWRYYLVKYDCMRSGPDGLSQGGLFYSESSGMGFDLCLITNERLSSYCDPYISGIVEKSEVDKDELAYWFHSTEQCDLKARWLRKKNGEVKIIRADPAGWVVSPPDEPTHQATFIAKCVALGMKQQENEWILEVPKGQNEQGLDYDTADRIDLGSKLLLDLFPLYIS